ASIARRASSRLPAATCEATWPLYGFFFWKVVPSAAPVHSPLMNCFASWASTACAMGISPLIVCERRRLCEPPWDWFLLPHSVGANQTEEARPAHAGRSREPAARDCRVSSCETRFAIRRVGQGLSMDFD